MTSTSLTTDPAALEAARVALRNDEFVDAPGPSVHLNGDVADALLVARGWRIESRQRPRGTEWSFIAPDGQRYWERDDALTTALTAEVVFDLEPAQVYGAEVDR